MSDDLEDSGGSTYMPKDEKGLFDSDLVRRRRREAARDRLLRRIAEINGAIRTPLADIVRDHVLVHLPPASLLRLSAVHPSWARRVASPLFPLAQAQAHRSLSGVFACHPQSADRPSFLPVDADAAYALPDPSLSFLPSSVVSVRSSSRGLLCCFAPDLGSGSFFVCNPATTQWTAIPEPPRDPGRDPALALVFEPSALNLRSDYALVCAFEAGGAGSGVYGFQNFSSVFGGWWISSQIVPAAGGLVVGSAVSAGGTAYWRTAIGTVVGYDPGNDRVHVVSAPPPKAKRWELGTVDAELYCVTVTKREVVAYALERGDRWARVSSIAFGVDSDEEERRRRKDKGLPPPIPFEGRPWPMRFQGASLEAVLWECGRIVAVDLTCRRLREVGFYPGPAPGGGEGEYVPHISTLAPVRPAELSAEAAALLLVPNEEEMNPSLPHQEV